MPVPARTETPGSTARGRVRSGYGLLSAAWLVVLAGGALAGWLAHTAPPDERPVDTAVRHAGELPPAPAATIARRAVEAIDPRVRQLAARDTLTPLPAITDRDTADQATPTAAASASVTGITPSVTSKAPNSDTTPRTQLAVRTDVESVASTAGPMPPPIPRSVVSPAAGHASERTRYSVQVGAFRLRENAVERAARLSEAGYDVRIVHLFATRSRLYMVRLGRFDARPAAMAYARQLSRDVGVETWPVRD